MEPRRNDLNRREKYVDISARITENKSVLKSRWLLTNDPL